MAMPAQLPCPTATRRALVTAAAIGCLDGYVDAWVTNPPAGPEDAGPAVLAALVTGTAHPDAAWHASRAITVWQHGFHRGTPNSGLDRGQAAYTAGLACAALTQRRLAVAADREAQALAARWTVGPVTRDEYTLVHGLPGAVLTLAGAARPDPHRVVPLARRLAAVPDWPADLDTGLGYGVAGVAAALRAAVEIADPVKDVEAALRRACDWLVGRSTVDRNGVPAWPAARHGWAHGTPGIAWTLWDAGRVLDDPRLQRRATRAMESYCDGLLRPEPPDPVDLTFRTGAAGVVAVADAFTRHAGLPGSGDLRDRTAEQIVDRLDEVRAGRCLLLDGASGTLAALLTASGGDRRWLIPYGLR
jgi:hypothetical protein